MKVLRLIVSIIFLIIGGFILSSIVRGMSGLDDKIGLFLWKSYSYMALGLPFLFFWLFIVLFSGKIILYKVFCPALMLAPFLAFSVALRIMFWNPTLVHPPFWITAQLLGNTVATVLWFFIGSLLLSMIAIFYTVWTNAISTEENVQTEIQNIKHSLSNNYAKVTRFLKNIQSPAHTTKQSPAYIKTPVQNPYPHTQQTSRYNSIDVSSHSQNHSASQYVPETSITQTHQERYLLIFDRNKLKKEKEIKLYKELAAEGVQDSVPLGAEGYVSPHYGINEDNNFKMEDDFSTNDNIPYSSSESEYKQYQQSKSVTEPHYTNTEKPPFDNEHDKYQTIQSDNFEMLDKNDTPTLEIDKYNYIENPTFNSYQQSADGSQSDDENLDDTFTQNYNETEEQENAIKKKLSLTQKLKNTSKKRKQTYRIPIHGILETPIEEEPEDPREAQLIGLKLEETLKDFNIEARVLSFFRGPVVTLFEILPAPGVRLSRIVSLADNIALELAATSIRIVAPIPGKGAVGIEVPNAQRTMVSLSELVTHKTFFNKENALPIALGRDISNNVKVSDLSRTPHLLIAGATGSGKSVCINSIICSLLFRCSPDELKFLLIDPKMVELNFYNDIPHLLTPVIDNPEKSIKILRWCIEEMEKRYKTLHAYGAREIRSYNSKLAIKNVPKTARMPYIVIIIDEFADLMLTCGKELEILVSRIAAKSRAVGIHLVLATQRPSTDVITGVIKANIPSRIAFMVSSKTDSRIIIDQNGADALLGKGDMLFSSTQDLSPIRIQGAFLSENEVVNVVNAVKEIGGDPDYLDEEELFPSEKNSIDDLNTKDDPLWDDIINTIRETNKTSASQLQRNFKIGYNRAARLIDEMENEGIVGPAIGSKPRDVFI